MMEISSWKDDRIVVQTCLLHAFEMTPANRRFLESLQDSRTFRSPFPVLRSTAGSWVKSRRDKDKYGTESTSKNRYPRRVAPGDRTGWVLIVISPLKKGSDPLEGIVMTMKNGCLERVRPLFQRAIKGLLK